MNIRQQKHSRFLVVDYKADEISVVWRSVAFPGKFYSSALGIVGPEFYYMTFTLGKKTREIYIRDFCLGSVHWQMPQAI